MTSTTGFVRRGSPRAPTFGVAPYVPGRTTAEYLADGALRAVEAADEVAALAAYATAHGLTVSGDPRAAKSGKQTFATLSDGREYVARTLRAAHAELMETEPIVADPADPAVADPAVAPPGEAARTGRPGSSPPSAVPDPTGPVSTGPMPIEPVPRPPEPPELLALDAVGPADLDGVRSTLLPLSWSIAAALWGATGDAPQSVQAVAERFAVSPGFVRMVAASVIRLAAADRPT